MKGKKLSFIITLVLAIVILAPALFAGTIYITSKTQEHSQWCWDASCQMCFTNYGKNYSQCSIANYIFYRSDCCGVTTFDWYHTCNQGGTVADMTNTLSAGGDSSTPSYTYLSWTSVKSQIDTKKRPFIMCWYWTGGGGHAIVGYGYRVYNYVNQVAMNDPWPGEGASWASHSYCVSASDHSWGATVKCN